jgi:hypothetical protein
MPKEINKEEKKRKIIRTAITLSSLVGAGLLSKKFLRKNIVEADSIKPKEQLFLPSARDTSILNKSKESLDSVSQIKKKLNDELPNRGSKKLLLGASKDVQLPKNPLKIPDKVSIENSPSNLLKKKVSIKDLITKRLKTENAPSNLLRKKETWNNLISNKLNKGNYIPSNLLKKKIDIKDLITKRLNSQNLKPVIPSNLFKKRISVKDIISNNLKNTSLKPPLGLLNKKINIEDILTKNLKNKDLNIPKNLLKKKDTLEDLIKQNVKPVLPKPLIAPPTKKVTWEDLITENLEPIPPKVTKFLPAGTSPRLGDIVKVKSYQRVQNGKLITVSGYDRKGVLVSTSKEINDSVRRQKLRRIRKLKESRRVKQEQIELEKVRREEQRILEQKLKEEKIALDKLNAEKVLNAQKSLSDDLVLNTDTLLNERLQLLNNIDLALREVRSPLLRKTYKDFINEVDITLPKINLKEVDSKLLDKEYSILNSKVRDIIDGFDSEDIILSEVKRQREKNLNYLTDIRKSQKNIEADLDKDFTKVKNQLKNLNKINDEFQESFIKFKNRDLDLQNNLTEIKLLSDDLDSLDVLQVGDSFYNKQRKELLDRLSSIQNKELKHNSFNSTIQNSIKSLEEKVKYLENEKIKVKNYNKELFTVLNKYDNQFSKIPTNKFYISNEATKANEKLNRIINNNYKEANDYISNLENKIQKEIEAPLVNLRKIELELDELLESSPTDLVLRRKNVYEELDKISKKIKDDEALSAKYAEDLEIILEPSNLKELTLERLPLKKSYQAESIGGSLTYKSGEIKSITIDEALKQKQLLIKKLRDKGISNGYKLLNLAGNTPQKTYYKIGIEDTRKQLLNKQSQLEKYRNDIYNTLENFDFSGTENYLNTLKNKGLLNYYKNTNPELYSKLIRYEDYLLNKAPNRFKYLLEDIYFKISRNKKEIDIINQEFDELLNLKVDITIKKGVNEAGDDILERVSLKSYRNRVIKRMNRIDYLSKKTRKRNTLKPFFDTLHSKNFKVEGENSIFNNIRNNKLTPAQETFIETLSPLEKEFLDDIISKDLDSDAIKFFYLSRLKELYDSRKIPKKTFLGKNIEGKVDLKPKSKRTSLLGDRVSEAKALINFLNYENNLNLELVFNRDTGLMNVGNYNSVSTLGRLSDKTAKSLERLEKVIGITEDSTPQLSDLQNIYSLSGEKITGHSDFLATEKYFKDNEELLNINDLLYTRNLLRENLKQLDNRLYIENFSESTRLSIF